MLARLLLTTTLISTLSARAQEVEKKPAEATEEKKAAPAAAPTAEEDDQEVPEDLLEDEHLKEEFGVNQFTAPSIRKLFKQLADLGALPYDKLKRPLPKSTPSERVLVALSMGVLIGDGFLAAQTEQVEDLENIGRAVLRHAKALSAGAKVTEHAKSILESSVLGNWTSLRDELAATQRDVEREMVLLRDMEIAHFIAMGGWLRGLQIAGETSLAPFKPEKARIMARADLVEYFTTILTDLDPKYASLEKIGKLRSGLEQIRELVDLPEGKSFTEDEVKKISAKANELMVLVAE